MHKVHNLLSNLLKIKSIHIDRHYIRLCVPAAVKLMNYRSTDTTILAFLLLEHLIVVVENDHGQAFGYGERPNQTIGEIINYGFIPKLADYLRLSGEERVVCKTMSVLKLLAGGNIIQRSTLINNNSLHIGLISVLANANDTEKIHAICLITKLFTNSSADHVDLFLNQEYVARLCSFAFQDPARLGLEASKALATIAKRANSVQLQRLHDITTDFAPNSVLLCIASLVHSDDSEVILLALNAIITFLETRDIRFLHILSSRQFHERISELGNSTDYEIACYGDYIACFF